MVGNPTIGIIHWCPYCGRPLQEGLPVCPMCGYVLGKDLGAIVAPRPFHQGDVYRQGRWHEPPIHRTHFGLPVSPWDGGVRDLVSSDGKWRWDGHRWIPDWTKVAPVSQPPPSNSVRAGTMPSLANPVNVNWGVGIGIVLAIVAGLMIFFFVILPNSGISGSWYVHWSCGSQAQCAQSSGAYTGVSSQSFANKADCEAALPQSGFQPWDGSVGSWCSQSNRPGDTGP